MHVKNNKKKRKAKILAEELGLSSARSLVIMMVILIVDMNQCMPKQKCHTRFTNDTQAVAPTLSEGQNLIYSSVSIVYKIK